MPRFLGSGRLKRASTAGRNLASSMKASVSARETAATATPRRDDSVSRSAVTASPAAAGSAGRFAASASSRATWSLLTRMADSMSTTTDEKRTMSSLKPPGPRES
eukprot:scaffold34384_cov63-Phaeocystis_antarctica.AAC.2